jgi:hypothetical protein
MTPFREQAVTRSRRSISAARALYREGLLSESHTYMANALHALLEAWRPEAPETPPEEAEKDGDADESAPKAVEVDPDANALAAIEAAGYRKASRLRKAAAAVRAADTGTRTSLARVEWIWAEVARLARFSERKFASPAAQKRARIRLFVTVGLSALVVLAIIAVLWWRPRVVASATFGSEHPAYQVFDGVDSTEWLLPETSPGWVELRFRAARNVRVVRLVNAHNRYYMDRASERVRVTAYAGGESLGSAEGKFKGIVEKRSTLDLALNASGVTRLRVEVLSYFGRGGGLAEIEFR